MQRRRGTGEVEDMADGPVDPDRSCHVLTQDEQIVMRGKAMVLRGLVIVDDDDLCTIVQQRLGQVGANKSRAACDDDPVAAIAFRFFVHMRLIS